MRVRTKHLLPELIVRSKLALKNTALIEIVETHRSPSSAQKTANMLGYEQEAYSVWALSALKRDYPEDYNEIQVIQTFKSSK